MAAERHVPMGANRFLALFLLVLKVSGCAFTQEPSPPAASTAAESNPPGQAKKESSSHRSAHHIQVPVDDSPAPELTRAESEIEKRNYAAAEPSLRKLVEKDSTNYVAWFDLGFVENALDKVDESIAAYRKSVAAKPDVFESNLNLGLQLAKTGQPDAEMFLRAATKLKPTSHVAEGQYRTWLSLGQTMEPTARQQRFNLKKPSHIFRRGGCSSGKTDLPTPSRNTSTR
jgi:predicted Zn-dependent protease